MAAKKVKDLAVKTGTYTVNGETKGRWENIGSMFKSDDGTFFFLLKRTFNPAGVAVEDGRDSIVVSVFDLKEGNERSQSHSQPPSTGGASGPRGDLDGDIPFNLRERGWLA